MVTMHPKLAQIFNGKEQFYPAVLEAQYARVFNNIMKYWGTPKCDEYLEDLIIDKRGGRKGFPPEVAADIVRLSKIHARYMEVLMGSQEEKGDPWHNEAARSRLAGEQVEYSMAGFWKAVETGNDRAVKLFLETVGVKPNEKDQLGATALIKAAMLRRTAVVSALLEAGGDPNLGNPQGLTPLHWAAFKGFGDIAALLLDKGANPDAKGGPGVTPLMQAAMNGHAELCSLLLARGAKAAETDNEGLTALHKAASDGQADVVKALLAAGADREAKSATGATPLALAERRKRAEVIALLRP